ncbi:oligosaccharide flippase family protein [Candidatus Gottesmanbacteria bacterium]|nr:oligosaccharide flippase family protein [Candidatus Gottesmanbacteria bacterium]
MSPPHSTRWLVGKNTIAQIIGKAVGAVVTFAITLLIAQKLGAIGYGEFTKIITYVTFFYLIADFGLNAVFLQQVQNESQQEYHRLWHALIMLRLVLSLVFVFGSLLLLPLLPSSNASGYTNMVKVGILLFSPTIIFQALLTSTNAIFQKNLRYDLSTIATSIGSATSLVLVFIAMQQEASLIAVISSLFVGSMVTAGIALFLATTLHTSWTVSWDGNGMKKLFLPALPLAATLLLNLVYFRADSVILTLTRPTSDVGIYGFAYKFFEFPLVVPTFFMNSLYPLLLAAKRHSQKQFLHLAKKAAGILFAFLLWVSLFSFSHPLPCGHLSHSKNKLRLPLSTRLLWPRTFS